MHNISHINHFLKVIIILFCIGAVSKELSCQVTNDMMQEDMITNIIENLETNEEFDFNTLYDHLEVLKNNPLNINNATEEDLKGLLLLDDIQIQDLLNHLNQNGDLLSLMELQSIPSFDLNTIRNLLPFISANESEYFYNVPLKEMLKEGRNELYLKWRRVMQDQKGYQENNGERAYEGDPNRFYVRYRHSYENRLKFGFTAEKDPGEAFFSGSNKNGFDFYSAHIHLRDYRKWLKDIVVGDYTIGLGQGLILHNSFGGSKSAQVMNVKRGGRSIRSYNSVNEALYFRGAAAEVRLTPAIDVMGFVSIKKIDASTTLDTLEIETGQELFTSLILGGYHRTQSEISKESTVTDFTTGGRLKYYRRDFKVSLNTVYQQFGQTFDRTFQYYNQFQFRGKSIANTSVDYSYRWNNVSLYGETAMSDNGAIANIHGLLMSLDRKIDLAVVYRNYSPDYQSTNSNSFGETAGTTNEKGLYTGLSINPNSGWKINAYADLWAHPWLRFRRDAPSIGKEYLIRIDHFKKRKYTFYAQYKYEEKGINSSNPENKIDQVIPIQQHRLRLHAVNNISKSLSLRNRVEYSWFNNEGVQSRGYLLYQDVVYKPMTLPISVTGRYAIFDTDNFDNRIYSYENDLIYEFFIPFFQDRGRRYYINLRYDVSRMITAEFRYAQTTYDNVDIISSGNEQINGNKRTELKAQLRFVF